jgi:hypothetical protein
MLPRRRIQTRRRTTQHRWTEEELDTLVYLRSQDVQFRDIRESYFPSIALEGIKGAYARRTQSLIEKGQLSSTIYQRRRTKRHLWTEEELNTLVDLRSRGWNFKEIQEKHFPSIALNGVRGAYTRCVQSLVENGQPFGISLIVDPWSVARNEPMKRYNLRPNRPTNLHAKDPRYLVDRSRFPHFFESYKKYIRLDSASDKDFVPPSHSPTPTVSDRSPSIISTQLSDASSLELFGLEARPCSSPGYRSTISNPSQLNDTDVEFFSSAEHFSSP